MVKVVFTSALQSATNGEGTVELDCNGTVSDLLKVLGARYGERFARRVLDGERLRRYVNIYIDGKDIRFLSGLETPVAGTSTLDFIPAVSGG